MTPLRRLILTGALLLQGAIPVFAQDAGDVPTDVAPAETRAEAGGDADSAGEPLPAEEANDTAADERVPETDDESYLDIDEKDFTPSEEIPTDQSITFPVDI